MSCLKNDELEDDPGPGKISGENSLLNFGGSSLSRHSLGFETLQNAKFKSSHRTECWW